MLCNSIPSLLSVPTNCASYYAEQQYNNSAHLRNGGLYSTSAANIDEYGGGSCGDFLLPYRCDFAKHVQYENGQFTMRERIYLPELPGFKIIGRFFFITHILFVHFVLRSHSRSSRQLVAPAGSRDELQDCHPGKGLDKGGCVCVVGRPFGG